MAVKRKNVHVGGQQLPLLTPTSKWKVPKELPDLRRHKFVAEDTETRDMGLAAGMGPSWHVRGGHVAGFSLAWKGGQGYYPIQHPDTEGCFDREQVRQWHVDHHRAGVRFVFHNGPYDVGWLDADLGVPPPPEGQIDDTTAMAVIVEENRYTYKLDALCKIYGLPGKDPGLLNEAGAAYGFEGETMSNLWRLPARYVGPYAEADAAQTLALAETLRPIMEEENTVEAYQLECDLIPMIHAMRKRGILMDEDYIVQAREKLQAERDAVLAEISDRLKHRVGLDEIRSNSFMCRVCDELKVSYPRTKTGMGSFRKEWTRKHPHWFPRLTARAEQLEDMQKKFLHGFLQEFSCNGRIHASINQFLSDEGGTRSHRFSYSNPPLQQMPSRDEEFVALIRGAFLPEPGGVWGALDYSQQEYRLIVHYAERYGLTRASEAGQKYRDDPATDFHSMVAEMTGLERKPAKDTNFAKAFGAGVKKFAVMIGKSEEEAAAIMDQYDEEMPFVKELNQLCSASANRKGYILLLDGARSHFNLWEAKDNADNYGDDGRYIGPKFHVEAAETWRGKRLRRYQTHKAMNRKIQGSAARQTKMAMRECWREGLVPMLQMHDELDFSFTEEKQGIRAAEIMCNVVKLTVPMKVDAEYGLNWGAAKLAWSDLPKRVKKAVPGRRGLKTRSKA